MFSPNSCAVIGVIFPEYQVPMLQKTTFRVPGPTPNFMEYQVPTPIFSSSTEYQSTNTQTLIRPGSTWFFCVPFYFSMKWPVAVTTALTLLIGAEVTSKFEKFAG
jgi:hypothetical protein